MCARSIGEGNPERRGSSGGDDDGMEDCVVCAEPMRWPGIGSSCSGKHESQVCGSCTLRLRMVVGDKRCCICQQDCQVALVVPHQHEFLRRQELIPWSSMEELVTEGKMWKDENACVYYTDYEHFQVMQLLSRPVCPVCSPVRRFQHVHQLKAHVKKDHKKFYCDLCLEGKQRFIGEQHLYTSQELKRHLDGGEPSIDHVDGANAFKGHPLCRFCQRRFYGEGEIYHHMERNHEHCFLCRQQNPREYTYYKNYPHLEEHFMKKHHICSQSTCKEQKFVVFKTAEELKRHEASKHPDSMSKIEKKRALQLQAGFTISQRNTDISAKQTSKVVATNKVAEMDFDPPLRIPGGAWASAAGSSGQVGDLSSTEEFPLLAGMKGKGAMKAIQGIGGSRSTTKAAVMPRYNPSDSVNSWNRNPSSPMPPPGFVSSKMKTIGSAGDFDALGWPTVEQLYQRSSLDLSHAKSKPDGSQDVLIANKLLTQTIKAKLDTECFSSFRDATFAFQRGEIDGHAYLSFVQNLGLSSMAAEIARLCPNRTKREELLQLCKQDRGNSSSAVETAHAKQEHPTHPVEAQLSPRVYVANPCPSDVLPTAQRSTYGQVHETAGKQPGAMRMVNDTKNAKSGLRGDAVEVLPVSSNEGDDAQSIRKEKPRRRKKEILHHSTAFNEGMHMQFLDKATELSHQKQTCLKSEPKRPL